MRYELWGRVHAALVTLRDERGQGTIEYVGLILLLAVLLGGIVAAAHGSSDKQGIATAIVKKLKDTIDTVGGDGKK
jgi:Flp pilus assembly protein TadG